MILKTGNDDIMQTIRNENTPNQPKNIRVKKIGTSTSFYLRRDKLETNINDDDNAVENLIHPAKYVKSGLANGK